MRNLYLFFLLIALFGPEQTTAQSSIDPYAPVEAEEYTSAFGVRPGAAEGAVGYIEYGDYLVFADVAFGEKGPYNGIVRAASRTAGGTIEFRAGSIVGPLIATAEIAGTGSWTDFENFEIALTPEYAFNDPEPLGTTDLYLIFTGGGGYLFDVDRFFFGDTSEVAITGLEINNCPTEPVLVGEVYDFDATITPVNTTNKFLAWYASDGVSVDYISGEFLTQTPGTYTVSTTSFSDGSFSDACTFEVTDGGQAAFNGPHTIPGTIEAEFYDLGGPVVAYGDDDRKQGEQDYRAGDFVDVVAKSNASNGLVVGWTADGEYLEYTLDTIIADRYDITLTYSAGGTAPGDVELLIDSEPRVLFNDLETTGGWNRFATSTRTGVNIQNGTTLRLQYRGGGFDLDRISFTPSATVTSGTVAGMHSAAVDPGMRAEDDELAIYPNPSADGFFTVRMVTAAAVTVTDVSGRALLRRHLPAGTSRLDLSEVPAGVYLLRAGTHGLKLVRR